MARIEINDLSAPEKELTEQEMGDVLGGRIYYRKRTQVRYSYTSSRRRRRPPRRRRIRQTRTVVSAHGANYGRWH